MPVLAGPQAITSSNPSTFANAYTNAYSSGAPIGLKSPPMQQKSKAGLLLKRHAPALLGAERTHACAPCATVASLHVYRACESIVRAAVHPQPRTSRCRGRLRRTGLWPGLMHIPPTQAPQRQRTAPVQHVRTPFSSLACCKQHLVGWIRVGRSVRQMCQVCSCMHMLASSLGFGPGAVP